MPKKKNNNYAEECYYLRPYQSDVKEIEKRIRLSGNDKSETLREIVKAGLYHLRLTEARLDPTHGLAKMKTVEAVREGVKPTNNQLDSLLKTVSELNAKMNDNIQISQQIDRKLQATGHTIIEMLQEQHKGLGEMFRNLLVQRGLFYIYLLAYRAGTIYERKDIPEKEWIGFVNESVKLTSDMAADELLNKKWQDIENQFIPNLAKEIFNLVRASRPKN